jgi:hypothetical protein
LVPLSLLLCFGFFFLSKRERASFLQPRVCVCVCDLPSHGLVGTSHYSMIVPPKPQGSLRASWWTNTHNTPHHTTPTNFYDIY